MVLGIFYQKKRKKQRKEDTRRKNKKINTKKPMVLNKKIPGKFRGRKNNYLDSFENIKETTARPAQIKHQPDQIAKSP